MIIFIFGKETYLSLEKLAAMRSKFLEKFDPSGMNLAEFDAQKSSVKIGDVAQAIQSAPFLGEKRMVIIKGLLSHASTKPDAKPWLEQLEKTPDSTIAIVVDDVSVKKGEKHSMIKALGDREDVHVYPCESLEGMALERFAVAHAKKVGLVIGAAELRRVVAMVGGNLWQLTGELEKLTAYGAGKAVTGEAISLLVRGNGDDQMFALMDALSGGNVRQALALLREQRQFGTADGQLFAMLARQVRLMLAARSMIESDPGATKQALASALGLHPFVAQKSLAQARRFSLSELEELHDRLFELDRGAKSGGVDFTVAVDRVVSVMLT